jgi:hypothetical protein
MTTKQQTETGYYESEDPIVFYDGPALDEIPEIPPEDTPLERYVVKVVVSGGSSPTGSVIIEGTQSGSPKSDTITVNGNNTYYSIQYFDAETVPDITTTGLSDETPAANLVISPVDTVYMQPLYGMASFTLDWHTETVMTRDEGGDEVRYDHWMICDQAFEVGDSIRYNGETYTVDRVQAVKLMNRRIDHYKVWV